MHYMSIHFSVFFVMFVWTSISILYNLYGWTSACLGCVLERIGVVMGPLTVTKKDFGC